MSSYELRSALNAAGNRPDCSCSASRWAPLFLALYIWHTFFFKWKCSKGVITVSILQVWSWTTTSCSWSAWDSPTRTSKSTLTTTWPASFAWKTCSVSDTERDYTGFTLRTQAGIKAALPQFVFVFLQVIASTINSLTWAFLSLCWTQGLSRPWTNTTKVECRWT